MTAGSTQDVQEDPAVGGIAARVGHVSLRVSSLPAFATSSDTDDSVAADEAGNGDCGCILCGDEIICDGCGLYADQLWREIVTSNVAAAPPITQQVQDFDPELRRDCGVVLP